MANPPKKQPDKNPVVQPQQNQEHKEDKTKPAIVEFAQKRWVVVWTLLATTIASISGCWDFYRFWTDSAHYKYKHYGSMAIQNGDDKANTILLIGAAILNDGQKPFFPSYFGARMIIDGDTLFLQPITFADSVTQDKQYGATKVKFSNLQERNLQLLINVLPDEAKYGVLLFNLPMSLKKYRDTQEIKLEVVCFDIFNNKYSTNIDVNNGDPFNTQVFLKMGILVGDTTNFRQ